MGRGWQRAEAEQSQAPPGLEGRLRKAEGGYSGLENSEKVHWGPQQAESGRVQWERHQAVCRESQEYQDWLNPGPQSCCGRGG